MNSHQAAWTVPNSPAMHRQIAAILAGHRSDEAAAREHLADPGAAVRAAALGALARSGRIGLPDFKRGFADRDPSVRRRTCEIAAGWRGAASGERELRSLVTDLALLLEDADDLVCEAASWALGELCEDRGSVSVGSVDALCAVVRGHRSPLCRESAVAALGTIGDTRAVPSIIAALSDRPAVRRRAVVALAPFDHPDAEDALRDCLTDRDWQVRQSAEDLLS